MTDERELAAVADELDRLANAVIDTSTLVYCDACGAFPGLSSEISLHTVPQVVAEYGSRPAGVHILDMGSGTADALVIACAAERAMAVLSEDRKLLLAAERSGVPFYNTLIMLALLLLRGRIDESEHQKMRASLIEAAHYSRRVLAYGDDLAWYILTRR